MARYEYECPAHGAFIIEQSILEPTPPETVDCPTPVTDPVVEDTTLLCGAKSQRVYTPPGIIFAWHH